MTADDDRPDETPGELTRRTVGGIRWSYAQTIVAAGLQIVMTVIMARLLTPAAFGLVALAQLALRFVTYFARAGIAQAVVQKPELRHVDVRAAFTASVTLGALFGGVVVLAAPLAALAFRDPSLTPVLRWMALSLPLSALGSVSDAILQRELRFRALAVRRILSYVVGYLIVGIALASAGWGVDALVAAVLTQAGVGAALSYAATRHSVVPSLDAEAHRTLLGFGSRVSVIGFFEFLGDELDTMAVGRFAGVSATGIYNRGYLIVRLPLEYATSSLSSVLFPAFSATQSDLRRLGRAYLSAVSGAAGLVMPLVAGIGVAAPELVLVLLGPQWTEAVSVVPWIAAAGAISALSHFAGVVAEARGTLNPKLAIATSNVVVLGGLLALARGRGLWAYGAALAASEVYAQVLYLRLTSRVIDVPVRRLLVAYRPGILTAVSTGGAILLARLGALALGLPTLAVFLLEVAVGALGLLLNLHVGALRPIRRDVHGRLHRAGLLEDVPGGILGRAALRLLIGRTDDGVLAEPPPPEPVDQAREGVRP